MKRTCQRDLDHKIERGRCDIRTLESASEARRGLCIMLSMELRSYPKSLAMLVQQKEQKQGKVVRLKMRPW